EALILKEELLKLTYHDIPQIDELAKGLNIDFVEFLQNEKPYMNWDEIKELSEQGFYMGGHSINHPYYYQTSLEEQIKQTKESVDIVKEKLNLNYRIFSFPFTDFKVTMRFFNHIYD